MRAIETLARRHTCISILLACIALCACSSENSSGVTQRGRLELDRRVESFNLLYLQFLEKYSEGNILQIPNDIKQLKNDLYVHSAINLEFLQINTDAIDIEDGKARHIILLHDLADLGNGVSRVILFADGHVEISSRVSE